MVATLLGALPAATVGLLCLVMAAPAEAQLRDVPVIWYSDDMREIPKPSVREPSLILDNVSEALLHPIGRFTDPGRNLRKIGALFGGDHVQAAADINALDEVPNSSWFSNRIGLFPMSPDAVARGSGDGVPPDHSGPWTVVKAKTQGVTTGFTVKDARGTRFLLKFDAPGSHGMSIAATSIVSRLFYSAGYNTTEEYRSSVRREGLVVGQGVQLKTGHGAHLMTEADLDSLLAHEEPQPDGSWDVNMSKLYSGTPVGRFGWNGRRKDDPNDHVNHEDRRELRGLRMLAAWVCHYDAKQGNSLDMYVEEDGRHFVRHLVQDVGATLGASALGAFPRPGYEYTLDAPAIGGRLLGLGVHEDEWRRLRRPEGLDEIGYFQSDIFDPLEFKPLQPNAAWANLTDRDGYWAAKIISAFTDQQIGAAVATGGYKDPAAAAYMTKTLAERRDKIARLWFDRVPPLDFFVLDGGLMRFHDLGVERNVYPGTTARYRSRIAAVTADQKAAGWSDWMESSATEVPVVMLETGPAAAAAQGPADQYPFLAVELQVNRGQGQEWSSSMKVYVARGSGRIVKVER